MSGIVGNEAGVRENSDDAVLRFKNRICSCIRIATCHAVVSSDINVTEFAVYNTRISIAYCVFRCKFSVSKSFQPNEVFNLICRVLSVTGDVLRKCVQTNDILAVATNIPDIHASAFDILKAVVIRYVLEVFG